MFFCFSSSNITPSMTSPVLYRPPHSDVCANIFVFIIIRTRLYHYHSSCFKFTLFFSFCSLFPLYYMLHHICFNDCFLKLDICVNFFTPVSFAIICITIMAPSNSHWFSLHFLHIYHMPLIPFCRTYISMSTSSSSLSSALVCITITVPSLKFTLFSLSFSLFPLCIICPRLWQT